jgi:hypothetical protein
VAARRRSALPASSRSRLALSEKGVLVADPEVELIGIPETDAAGASMPRSPATPSRMRSKRCRKPRRRDPDAKWRRRCGARCAAPSPSAGTRSRSATSTCYGVLFVVDQDLRAPEVAAIARLAAIAKPLYIVLGKADQFTAADRDAILLSIRAKMPAKFASGHIVSVACAPSPVEREIQDARGAVRLELRRPPSDIRALTNLLERVFPPAPGRTLRFEAA